MRRLLCWFGWHEWWATCTYSVYRNGQLVARRTWRECRHCPATEER